MLPKNYFDVGGGPEILPTVIGFELSSKISNKIFSISWGKTANIIP